MNAFYLNNPDGTPTDVSVCGNCGAVAMGVTNFDLSERCCLCSECQKPVDQKQGRYHPECELIREKRQYQERMDEAELVTDYTGPVYAEGVGGGSFTGYGYFADLNDLLENLVFHEGDRPAFAFCCESVAVVLDADDILENLTADLFEDASDHLNGVDDFRLAVDSFNGENIELKSWNVDYGRKVEVPPPPEVKP